MILLCISVFGFVQLMAAVKLLLLQPYNRKCFFLESTNAGIFQPLTANENSCQLVAAHQNLHSSVDKGITSGKTNENGSTERYKLSSVRSNNYLLLI